MLEPRLKLIRVIYHNTNSHICYTIGMGISKEFHEGMNEFLPGGGSACPGKACFLC